MQNPLFNQTKHKIVGKERKSNQICDSCFLSFFGAKMTKIEIKNPKLIVTNDYQ